MTALPRPPGAAHRHRGASFVEIFQSCIVYNDDASSDFAEPKTAPETQILVEHGKRLIFGREEDRGLRLSPGTLSLEVVALGDDGASEADIPVHDRTDRTVAGMLAETNPPDFPAALGVLYCNPAEGYEAAIYAQVEEAKAAAAPPGSTLFCAAATPGRSRRVDRPPVAAACRPIEDHDAAMIEALLFDVFGTVVDWRTGIARQTAAFFADSGRAVDSFAFADAWRAKYQPAMEEIRAGRRDYVPLDLLHRENLDATLAEFGLDGDVGPERRAALNRAWERLPPWPDAVFGLSALKASYLIAPCSNGSIALMVRLARSAALPWDAVLGADIARAYKPQPAVYRASAAALGLAPAQVMMVAAHNGDLAAARDAGLATAFVPRPAEYGPDRAGEREPTADWDAVAPDFNLLARRLEA